METKTHRTLVFLLILFGIGLTIFVFVWANENAKDSAFVVDRSAAIPRRTRTQLLQDLRESNPADFRVSLSNDVVGISRIISVNISDRSDDVQQWKAKATVEFVNSIGGIERKDLFYNIEVTERGGRFFVRSQPQN